MEIIASPSPKTAKNLEGYFPEWKTQIYSYDRKGGWMRLRQEFAGIPWLVAAPVEPETASSSGTLFPVLASREREKLGLYLRTRAGAVQFVAIDATPQCGAGVARALTPQRETLRPSANSKRGNRRNALSKTH